ncbi:diguanylate cyclase domain protein [Lyngbya aestuarii BL J]|uniref:Diguanylate cyclase domain protein n=1 Tax=Lyngbya aestuarii BL J TaxID=1348334 RepID=U7QQY7_9CYAN|nr:diguanylate cyclase [Lyngbya aestuarii]ERT09697.1 diguanylate cyclase domain protein [Lyngbya aestuarii BL J]
MSNSLESSQPENILIVDDHPENLKILTQMLSQQNYKIRKAINGKMALNSAFSKPPDLILLDIVMPEMDGYQVCQQIKENPITSEIPVIFMSALDEAFNKVKAFEVGGVDYITKPFQTKEVLARVQLQLQLQHQKQQLEEQNQKLRQEITKRQEVEIQLSLFNQAIFTCRNGVIITDATQPNNPIIYVNQAFEKITGYSASEVFGKNCRFLQGEDRDQPNLDIIRNALKNEKDCLVIMRNYRKDGTLFWNEVSISPVRDAGGNITHYIGIQTDITERQRIQTALEEANKKLQYLANIDGLTQIANRRSFDETLNREWCRATREQQPLSLILCDVDYFKAYNDYYGHLQGDECLIQVAQAISQVVRRPADLVARYGGEEFVVILPNTDGSGAVQVAQLIQEQIRQLQSPHVKSDVSPYITLSLGISSIIPSCKMSSEQLVNAADRALYQAKQQGRNQIIINTNINPKKTQPLQETG